MNWVHGLEKHDLVKWFRPTVKNFAVSITFDFQCPKTGQFWPSIIPIKRKTGKTLRTYIQKMKGRIQSCHSSGTYVHGETS